MKNIVNALENAIKALEETSIVCLDQSKTILAYSQFGTPEDIAKVVNFATRLVEVVKEQPNSDDILMETGKRHLQAQEAAETKVKLENMLTGEDAEWLKSLGSENPE